jgi:molybdenum cofactor cytidylyltransferase
VIRGAGAIVLAAGAGSRFGGGKLLARLDGRPLLQHVLDALAEAGIDDPVVVTGADGDALESAITWRHARRVRNPAPERGLAGSLQLGWAAVVATGIPPVVLVALGDQPRLDPGVVRSLLEQPVDPGRPVVVARHPDGAPNPVRLEPEAAALVDLATGDRGLGPVIAGRPELVREVAVAIASPDVDTPADLVALAAASWASMVRENAAQVDRHREVPDGADFYATVRRTFIADPAREGDDTLEAILAWAESGDTWLDIGAGAGRYALPVARRVRSVIAVDPSAAMLGALEAGARDHGLANVRAIPGRWPPDPDLRAALGPDPVADVALIAHVSYDIADILPFLEAMESAVTRRCIAVLMERNPASVAAPFWPPVHGEARVPLPALPEMVELLQARGRRPVIHRVPGRPRRWADRDELTTYLHRQLWVEPGGPGDRRLAAAIDDLAVVEPDGSLTVPSLPTLDTGIVAWEPGGPV